MGGGEDKPVVVALAVDESERVTVQLTTSEAATKRDADGRAVHVKLKVDKAGYVHVVLDASSLHKPSWAKHQFKKLLNILTHKHHKKSKSGGTNSPSDKTQPGVQPPPASPHQSPFWKIGIRARTPTAQQA